MAGNVSEWVADWYSETYYSESPDNNPTGPPPATYRVLRGGSYDGLIITLKTFYRSWFDPVINNGKIGFRCASSTAP
jgi:formylglycine-generating enzyme required for sulfatase activity